ncbi:MAG: FAD-binding oxidoreductase [Fluviicola sp.]|nr:FAD-binding oxidoreductase [Fluviicola sp.]
MLQFNDLSFWEKQAITEGIDFAVIGGGIVGIACAIELRKLHPKAKIVLLERGYLSTGASTKNAGFACFGSVTELADDLKTMNESAVWDTVAMRYEGLKRLQERFSPQQIGLKINGSWDLLTQHEASSKQAFDDKISYFNDQIKRITGEDNCFSYDNDIAAKCGFQGIHGGYFNRLEGDLLTGNLIHASNMLLAQHAISVLNGIQVEQVTDSSNQVIIQTNFGELKTAKVAITVNGFAQSFLKDKRVLPARAQVLVTSELSSAPLPGTFHYQKGYYYFRSVGNRILLGGGRNLDFEGETTTSFEQTPLITNALIHLLKEHIIPNESFQIDYQWSGIMGVGNEKKPIIELTSKNIGIGVRMGGMGVAIGSLVGEELARKLN